MEELAKLYGTESAGRSLERRGPCWEAAIEFGIDVTLLLRNLELSPAQRLAQHAQQQRFAQEVRSRTVSPAIRRAQSQQALREKIEALGGPDPAWPPDLRDGH